MDDAEKKVLKRKRHTIASNLQLTDEYMRMFQNSNILNDSMMEQISTEGSNFQKVMKFMELLPDHCDTRGFQKLCLVLEKEHEWLADELRAELRAERRELVVEDYIEKEASTIVFREFGQTKRLSQAEKSAIKDLIAIRTQYAKEVWQRRLLSIQDELVYLRRINKERDSCSQELVDLVTSFIRIHKGRLRGTNGPLRQSSTMQKQTNGRIDSHKNDSQVERTTATVLREAVEDLKEMTYQSLLERDVMNDERARALKVLQVSGPMAKLDVELELALEKARKELEERQQEVAAKEEKARLLTGEISSIRKQGQVSLLSKDQVLQTMTTHLTHAHNKVRDLQGEMEIMRREMQEVQAETDMWREKCEKIEKTRRLGYVNPIKASEKATAAAAAKTSAEISMDNKPKMNGTSFTPKLGRRSATVK